MPRLVPLATSGRAAAPPRQKAPPAPAPGTGGRRSAGCPGSIPVTVRSTPPPEVGAGGGRVTLQGKRAASAAEVARGGGVRLGRGLGGLPMPRAQLGGGRH